MTQRKPYPTDLTDLQWQILAPLIPGLKPNSRPRSVEIREIINAIFYILASGCAWRMMPHDFPPWQTVYYYFRNWRREGQWRQMNQTLREKVRLSVGKKSTPSAVVIDSQSVKTTRKWQLKWDTMGVSLSRGISGTFL